MQINIANGKKLSRVLASEALMQASSRGVEWGVAWESPDKEVTMQNCAVAAPSFMPSGYSFTLDARRSTMPSWSLGLSQSYFPLLYTHTLALARIREMSNCLAVFQCNLHASLHQCFTLDPQERINTGKGEAEALRANAQVDDQPRRW